MVTNDSPLSLLLAIPLAGLLVLATALRAALWVMRQVP